MVKHTIPKNVLQEMARQKKEHPWMTQTQLRRVAMDHQRTGGEGAPKIILERTIAIPTLVKKKRRPVEQPPWYATVGSQFY